MLWDIILFEEAPYCEIEIIVVLLTRTSSLIISIV